MILLAAIELVTGPTGPPGPRGLPGATGATGAAGKDASVWLVGLFTVIGASVAGLIGWGTALYVENRRDRSRATDQQRREHAAARLICADLFAARRPMEHSLSQGLWVFKGAAPNDAWKQHGMEIAGAIPSDGFDRVFLAFAQIADLWRHAPDLFGQTLDADDGAKTGTSSRDSVENMRKQVQAAIDELHPLAYPDAHHEDGTALTAEELLAKGSTSPSLGTKRVPVPEPTGNDGKQPETITGNDAPEPETPSG